MASLRGLIVKSTFLFFLMYLVLSYNGVQGQEEDEDLELERQLKLLNKPPVKSIKTDYGDIYDCVDIMKQPALDHPLLKNHTVQMKPSSLPTGMINKESSENGFKIDGCPPGTVIIRRTQKEDLVRSKSLGRSSPGIASQFAADAHVYHFAVVKLKKLDDQYHGGDVNLSLYEPKVSPNQFSEAVLWVENGPPETLNSIQVGWAVNPKLYGDRRCRLFSYWSADAFHKTGCFNTLCAGFIQTSRHVTFGLTFSNISTAGGPQFEKHFLVYKDPPSGNWWLEFDHEKVGYWPSNLFTHLKSFADAITAGGEVYTPTNEPNPPMGSGNVPAAFNIRSTALARRLRAVNLRNELVDPQYDDFKTIADLPKCYYSLRAFPWGMTELLNSFLFGGPKSGSC